MTASQALKKGFQLCHSRFRVLWIETGWRVLQFLLSLAFGLMAIYILLGSIGLSHMEFESLTKGQPFLILKILVNLLQRNSRLILETVLLILCFIIVIWLLFASFFRAGTLALLAEERGENDPKDRWSILFCRKGAHLFPAFLLINLLTLFFWLASTISVVLVIKALLRLSESLESTSGHILLLSTGTLVSTLVFGITAIALLFFELSKLFMTRHMGSLLSAWNQAAEFLFVNLKPMGSLFTLISAIHFIFASSAALFLVLLSSWFGFDFFGALVFMQVLVCLGYTLARNYLFLIRSGSILALISRDS